MASYTLPRPILRLPFRIPHIRPISSTTPNLQPEPQKSSPQPARAMTSIISAISRDQAAQSRTSHKIRSALAETEASYRATDLERHLYRRFRPGDIYAPHDLSPAEQQKWRSRTSFGGNISKAHARTHKQNARDVFDVLGVHPLDEFKNFSIMAEFVTSMGRIRHRRDTGLRGVNQRRMAKAVRRAVGMGLMPSVHKHPEMLEKEAGELARKRDDKKIGNGGMNRGRGSGLFGGR